MPMIVMPMSFHAHDDHEPGRAAGGRVARRRTDHHALLFISMVLSWIAFVDVGFGHTTRAIALLP